MNKSLLAAVVSGALALPMAAQVQADEAEVQPHSHAATYEHDHEMDDGSMSPLHAHQHDAHPHAELHGHSATVYGSLRFGVEMSDDDKPDSSSVWDLGSNRASRFGIKGSMPAGEGLTAGFHLERGIGDTLSKRQQNVSLSGNFGTVKFGNQDAPYYSATTWDGSQTLGGLTDFGVISGSSRASGVSFASNLGGPFSFHVLAGSGAGGVEGSGEGADHLQVKGSLAAGPVTLNIGYQDNDGGQERIGGTVGGNIAAINWEVGYDAGTDACGMNCDDDRYGAHVGYAIGAGNAYVQYSELDSDTDTDDTDGWVVGYAHTLATNVVVYAEHGRTNSMDATDGEVATNTTVFAVKVGF